MKDPTTDRWRALEEHGREVPSSGGDGEFLPGVDERPDLMARRTFLKLMGASTALAGLEGCTGDVPGAVIPYANRPPETTPGIPVFYATSMLQDGYATGLLVETHEGRPTKVEGNPEHPASLGAAGVHEQAWVLGFYDPCRARTLRRGKEPESWERFRRVFGPGAEGQKRLHFLLEPTSSPLLASLIERLRTASPGARFHFYAPLASDSQGKATGAIFGRELSPRLDLARAKTIVALDSDFLASGPFHLSHARHFAGGRRPTTGAMSRLYAVEPSPTPTGVAADHRLPRRASEIERVAAALLAEVALEAGRRDGVPDAVRGSLERLRAKEADSRFVRACARDLARNAGSSLVVAGERQPAAVHALVALLNAVLGNVGRTISYAEPSIVGGGGGLEGLVAALDAKEVETLVVVGGNPVYAAPADLELGKRIGAIRRTVHLGLYENETSRACDWFVPEAHGLESWGDGRAYDGTLSLVQPLMNPLYGGKTASELLGAFLPGGEKCAREHLLEQWRALHGDDDAAWRRALSRGVASGPSSVVEASPSWEGARPIIERAAAGHGASGVEVVFARDHAVDDGRFTNNPWLLELPDPLTKLTWEKAALVSPGTAEALGVTTEDVVEIRQGDRALHAPVFVLPGHADGSVTLPLGYGREGAEEIARGVGFNAYALRTTQGPYFAHGFSVARARDGSRRRLATTQLHGSLEGRPIVRTGTLAELVKDPTFAKEGGPRDSLYAAREGEGNQWGMTIDLGLCNGCNACVVACQAENNTPVVGKQGVLEGREMHWIRVDRYFQGPKAEPDVAFQPMLCQHCEKAPCEYVCPVNATTHSPDGLNEQTYNRCVGTRFCSNNCPYKVRRFNWFNYQAGKPPIQRLAMNPDVTVRERGVMEKCTFCVQRIRGAEIRARNDGRPIRDGEVETACQGACPSRAIVFGSIADPGSAVSASWRDPRRYEVLGELGTRPRVQYLARIANPNPELAS